MAEAEVEEVIACCTAWLSASGSDAAEVYTPVVQVVPGVGSVACVLEYLAFSMLLHASPFRSAFGCAEQHIVVLRRPYSSWGHAP